ncbi:MAG TPA: hypothetical protein DD490_21095 [Acidobacteria bacterium]|nr:hypothetical protein [Acidobacteriota bacterium]
MNQPARQSEPPPEDQENWASIHVYYHEATGRSVRGFVYPLVTNLAKEGSITGFFFIRHGLGGPHIRLRLRPVAGAREHILDRMAHFARTFLTREPSMRSLPSDAIQSSNTAILKADPHEIDDSVYPDNSYHVAPFRPEIGRYGGPGRYGLSLDYFTLSSVAAVAFHLRFGDAARSVVLAQAHRLLLRQALGFASGEDELADLLRYGVDWMGRDLPKVVEKGNEVARSRMEHFLEILACDLAAARAVRTPAGAPDLSPLGLLLTGAGRLSAALGLANRETRLRIGASQLHMTASRLGLTHPEEVYLSCILTRTLGKACSGAGCAFSWPWEAVVGQAAEESAGELRQLLPHALVSLATLPGDGGR